MRLKCLFLLFKKFLLYYIFTVLNNEDGNQLSHQTEFSNQTAGNRRMCKPFQPMKQNIY